VLGSPGAGKSFLSNFLSRQLGLELVRLDDFFWMPGPVRMPTDQWRMLVVKLAGRSSWVMDGTYEASLDLRIPAAEAIVYIQSNRWACLWRVVMRRLLARWRHDESTYVQAITPFFVRYVLRFPRLTQPEVFRLIARHGPATPLVVVDSAKGVDRLIRQLEHAPPAHDGIPAGSLLADPRQNHHA